tara:strand:- start:283 stop:402 length:120 start_codon:yes stop_codon:yes gene_type:complete
MYKKKPPIKALKKMIIGTERSIDLPRVPDVLMIKTAKFS